MKFNIPNIKDITGRASGEPTINIASHGQIALNKFFKIKVAINKTDKAIISKDEESGKWYLLIGKIDGLTILESESKKENTYSFSNVIIAKSFLDEFNHLAYTISAHGLKQQEQIRSISADISTEPVMHEGLRCFEIKTTKEAMKINFKK